MFSPDAVQSTHHHTLRSKRTRRTGSDDSIKPPRAKRQRSALRNDTFDPPLTLKSDQSNELTTDAGLQSNGILLEDKPVANGHVDLTRQMTLRGGKKHDNRTARDGGATILVGIDPRILTVNAYVT